MEVSSQLCASAALSPGKEPTVPIGWEDFHLVPKLRMYRAIVPLYHMQSCCSSA